MPPTLRTRLFRLMFNWWPCYRGCGGRVLYIAGDWSYLKVKVLRDIRTRNYVGTIYGGSMYGAVDPIYMLMLLNRLGPGYIVWLKAAQIRFLKPGTRPLFAEFHVADEEVVAIKAELETARSIERNYTIVLADADGTAHCEVVETLYARRKQPKAA